MLAERIVQQATGRTIGGVVRIPADNALWSHVGLFDTVLVTDASQAALRCRQQLPQITDEANWQRLYKVAADN